jgi:hypothetical protein
MGAIERDRHRPWLAYALEESLERSLLAPRDVIDHANPEVLVTQLPGSVISELLSRALAIGTFSPAQVLESAPPALLAEHLNPDVMWRCLKEAAERGGLSRKGGTRSAPARQWFASVLSRALESELITPADVVRFLPPEEFVAASPRPVIADLIKAALGRGSFDAALVLEHITPAVIADNLETSVVWDCIGEAAARHFELGGAAAGKPSEQPAPHKTASAATTTATAPVAAARPAAKPIEKERPTAERKATLSEKAAAVMASGGGTAPSSRTTSGGSGPISPRAEIAAARAMLTPAAAPAASPALAPAAAAAAAAAAARAEVSEWSPADDLDVLEDQPLPFPLPR